MEKFTGRKYYIVITPFFPTDTKFQGPFIYDQVNAIIRNSNFNVVVFKPINFTNESLGEYSYDGIKVTSFKTYNLPSYLFNGLMDPLNVRCFLKCLTKSGIEPGSIAVVHSHTASCACYSNALKRIDNNIKTITQYHDLEPFDVLNGRMSSWKFNLNFKVRHILKELNYIDYHVCVSKRCLENLLSFPNPHENDIYKPYINRLKLIKNKNSKLVPKHALILYNGVDLNKFHSKKTASRDYFHVGCIGNYVNWKRHDILVRAIKILVDRGVTDIKISLLGNVPHAGFEEVKLLVNQLNLKEYIQFLDSCDHKNLIDFYNSLDLFVLPSVFEGYGCVFTEAHACGVPFITCLKQGISELVEEPEKWLINPDDAEDLADKINNYKIQRYPQMLTQSIDINILISKFLKRLSV